MHARYEHMSPGIENTHSRLVVLLFFLYVPVGFVNHTSENCNRSKSRRMFVEKGFSLSLSHLFLFCFSCVAYEIVSSIIVPAGCKLVM